MIKIDLTDAKKQELQDKHWNWFEKKCLPEIINCYKNRKLKTKINYKYGNVFKPMFNTYNSIIDDFLIFIFSEDNAKTNFSDIDSIICKKQYGKTNLKKMIVGDINSLRSIVQHMPQNITNKIAKEQNEKKESLRHLSNFLSFIFDYEAKLIKEFTFTKKSEHLKINFNYREYKKLEFEKWSKYHIVYELDLKTCPYCNRSFINPYFSDNGKTRADLDHFLPKSKYPYFAVSLFNLVPCCKVCNSSFKGSKEMNLDTHLNPYDKGMGNLVKFTITTTDTNVLKGMSDDFSVDYYPIDSFDYKRAKENLELFKIKELYNFHKDYIVELIKKHIIYNPSYIDEIFVQYNYLFQNKTEILQMLISNYIDDKDLDKRIFSKLTKDISEELGLLDLI